MEHYKFTSLIKPEIFVIKLIGFWNSARNDSINGQLWYKIYRYVVVAGLFSYVFFGWAYIAFAWGNITITDVTNVISIYSTGIANLITICLIIANTPILEDIVDQLQSNLFQPTSREQLRIADSGKKSGNTVRICIATSSIVACVFGLLIPLFSDDEKPMFIAYIPSWFPYRYFIIYQGIFLMYFGCVCFLNVSLNSNLLIEVAIQVDILRQKTITSEGSRAVINCIRHYGEVILMARRVQHLQHIALMAYFGCEILILCTGLFRLTAGISVADLGFMLPLVAAMAQMLYINCLYGSEIIYRSDHIAYSIFSTNWVGVDLRLQKIILIFMMFAKYPIRISIGGGFCSLSIPVFLTIMRTVYSYYTLLNSIK